MRLKQPLIISGGEVEWISCIGTDSALTISLVTYMDTIRMSIQTDLGYSTKEHVSSKDLLKAIELVLKQS